MDEETSYLKRSDNRAHLNVNGENVMSDVAQIKLARVEKIRVSCDLAPAKSSNVIELLVPQP